MYRPKYFQAQDDKHALQVIEQYPLATICYSIDNRPQASPLPFFIEASDPKKLLGHFAFANSELLQLSRLTEVLVIFNGPNGYISPAWYTEALNVPTWNYATVHVRGKPTVVRDKQQIEKILMRAVKFFEGKNGTKWEYDLPQSYRDDLLNAIVGLEIEITSIEAKFKLSQNRTAEDFNGAIAGLQGQNQVNQALISMMKLLNHH